MLCTGGAAGTELGTRVSNPRRLQRANKLQWAHGAARARAGQHVRAAATVGGNLTLARTRKLESDLAPLLLAAGARVTLASEKGQRCASSAGLEQGFSMMWGHMRSSGASRLHSADNIEQGRWAGRGQELAVPAESACARGCSGRDRQAAERKRRHSVLGTAPRRQASMEAS